ncbi:cryptochrome/photolyase family protein [Haliscomenobacter hydrossis]|uniref:Deoxyribodipyrimidine photolyase-related protein n=1 Tax=Haliscomenobacter hydrossis (strain ATCC 27775 / DSM 1100 / LMG 10767 / O) TaxID=760192 RepID=F4KSZ9_HALH1|nr:cryptochrome/photolyase family protein [Haliscomenobacter hydrossis]AEE49106.1 deoxyribodipyrimidine photolyase-related protein [Haliscomenobacter hydrossis DSM 1100]
MTYHTLRLILGDQLNVQHSWYRENTDGILYVLMEILPETQYVQHHIQKICGFFLAMRAFAAQLEAMGHHVQYFKLDDTNNLQGFAANCTQLIERHHIQHFEYQLPDEWRVDQQLLAFCQSLGSSKVFDSEHFFSTRTELAELFTGKKTYLMESFYRKMRSKHQILMEPDGKTPLTGRWNYDAENRKKMPATLQVPPALQQIKDASHIVTLLAKMGVKTIGTIDPQRFNWPITRVESLALLEHFIALRLPAFGDYQDAMTDRDWLLFHSRLSFSMNLKLISPQEVITACIDYWQAHPETVPYSALEGFVRQIVGWREYMRGIYWAEMPRYQKLNYFEHTAALPSWFWHAETKMNCLSQAIGQSLEYAYAHHIQRLMLTGNFALLLGVHPDEVDAWYLGIYIDALEWVEITNTRGMSQFADGGIVGTKPYVSSANYIHKMSDHCSKCHYDKSLRHGPKACPFNALYWDFYDRHSDKLRSNPRVGMAYQVWDKIDGTEKAQILEHAAWIKQHVDGL